MSGKTLRVITRQILLMPVNGAPWPVYRAGTSSTVYADSDQVYIGLYHTIVKLYKIVCIVIRALIASYSRPWSRVDMHADPMHACRARYRLQYKHPVRLYYKRICMVCSWSRETNTLCVHGADSLINIIPCRFYMRVHVCS